MLVFIYPTIEGIDRQVIPFMAYSRYPLDVQFKVGEGNTTPTETASKKGLYISKKALDSSDEWSA